MSGVRVIRILEYTYPDFETAEKDMERWTTKITGPMGCKESGPGYNMRTVSLPVMTYNNVDQLTDGHMVQE